ncbi:toxin/anti-toxin system, HipA-like toxin module [Pseudomonas syringae]|uniref:type II toxin-antitoxin system HipA family toxin n=1 Tax=Pseudomonas syringae TaxID=317 RepID=UPI000BB6654F|nr:type II toxin-antitoxin system HipA family toxin [Pseudomonas syringae]PBP73977.1 toxin/anti-toxin system, HipA-like toxin module [Pseudomonas syringae]
MAQAYIYMECPVSGETLTLGKLTIQAGVGTFQYAPDAVQENIWVPDPFRYPLSTRSYTVTKNGGVPGFIDDAMPDGWGERLLHRVEKGPLDSIQLLLKSPNSDRAGNIMAGLSRVAQDGLGQTPPKAFRAKGLDHFIDACEAIYDSQLSAEQLEVLKVRDQRSSAGGARPKRTYLGDRKLILAKPRDKFDHYDLPSVEHACMTFAGLKGLQAANTSLYRGERINTLLVERFDRAFDEQTHRFRRLPMLSGLTLLDAEWKARTHPDWQYAALADELYRRGAPDVDRQALYRRMAYNVLVGYADDHPRNHAVIWKEGGWRLSPMYDVLPILDEGPAQALAMSVGIEGSRLNRGNLLSQHAHFALSKEQAEAALDEVAGWEAELHDYYSQFLSGAELDAAVDATSGARLKR